ncbi:MAG: Uma2 family endonuclease [Eubacterium sp.]|nr:Uma2 family endonuclease [Eubacterium sp.]
MTLKEMILKKEALLLTEEELAIQTGIPLQMILDIFSGVEKTPDRQILQKLEAALDIAASERGLSGNVPQPAKFPQPSAVREGMPAYGRLARGPCTTADYEALPDDRRAELIDGYIYDMSAPRPLHQIILFQLGLQLAACVEKHPACELFIAPCDVRLDMDQWTILQPDLFIVCDDNQITEKRIEGAPGFVVEVLSPSGRVHDLIRKLNKYRLAGVREYWIVDPYHLEILVYYFEMDTHPAKYGFTDTIPVRISEGECSVDFDRIRQKIQPYL